MITLDTNKRLPALFADVQDNFDELAAAGGVPATLGFQGLQLLKDPRPGGGLIWGLLFQMGIVSSSTMSHGGPLQGSAYTYTSTSTSVSISHLASPSLPVAVAPALPVFRARSSALVTQGRLGTHFANATVWPNTSFRRLQCGYFRFANTGTVTSGVVRYGGASQNSDTDLQYDTFLKFVVTNGALTSTSVVSGTTGTTVTNLTTFTNLQWYKYVMLTDLSGSTKSSVVWIDDVEVANHTTFIHTAYNACVPSVRFDIATGVASDVSLDMVGNTCILF